MAYRYQTKVQLHDTDAAGVLFFGHQFRMANDAYQDFLESCGFSFAEVLRAGKMLIPIVHAEADFLKPLEVGDRLTVLVRIGSLSTHSYRLDYDIRRGENEPVGTASTVHVTIDRTTGRKMVLPGELRTALESIKD